jgi:hypothetical protein
MIQQYKINTVLEEITFQQEQKSPYYVVLSECRSTYAAATGNRNKYTITRSRHLPKRLHISTKIELLTVATTSKATLKNQKRRMTSKTSSTKE